MWAKARIKEWKLKKEECCTELEVRQVLGDREVLPDYWESTAAEGSCQCLVYPPDRGKNTNRLARKTWW